MSNKKLVWKVITPLLTAVISAAASYYFMQVRVTKVEDIAKERLFYNRMILYLDASRNAFNNQIEARDRLFYLLERNHAPLPALEFEVT